MKESYLDYHYYYMNPESKWLFVTPNLDSHDLQLQVQELGHFIFENNHYTRRGPLESYQLCFPYSDSDGVINFHGHNFAFPQKNELLFLDCTQGYTVEGQNGGNAIFIHFWSPAIRYYYDLFMEANHGDPCLHAYSQKVQMNLHQLLKLYENPGTRSVDIYAETLIMEMVMDILQRLVPLNQNGSSDYIATVIRIINEQYSKNISLDMLADSVHLSKYYLSHIFKKETGLTLGNYLQQFRINKAKELLRASDLSQEAICERVGLYNCSYLSKLFRMYEGLTPDQYRKKWR